MDMAGDFDRRTVGTEEQRIGVAVDRGPFGEATMGIRTASVR